MRTKPAQKKMKDHNRDRNDGAHLSPGTFRRASVLIPSSFIATLAANTGTVGPEKPRDALQPPDERRVPQADAKAPIKPIPVPVARPSSAQETPTEN